ncbi:SGNH/GDSL hydrolase family protein [Marinobacter sp. JSM 1782161]|uniref:SGNH/GDSL hydrolase family protein n=1 Tax=Marinobacter sp. JSM 1782161 TaxID=2685906 RepID=UPI001403FDF1|nr:SGNH/GDSL hydrolase family protein [Marinobacter sp. JSM 1782161]
MHPLLTIPLLPVLLLEGRYVRARTPRLPEADGPRQGVAGEGPPLNLLILGDSAAAGVGADTQEQALAGQVVHRLARRYRVTWHLEARNGRRVQDYLGDDAPLPDVRPDVIVTSLGVNDVVSSIPPRRWLGQVERLIRELHERYQPALILFTDVPPMDYFPALPQPLRRYLGDRARRFNNGLGRRLPTLERTEQISVLFENDPDLMAADGFHPGPAGYRVWANEVAARVFAHFPVQAPATEA